MGPARNWPFSCRIISQHVLLISNDFHPLSATPRDTDRDMDSSFSHTNSRFDFSCLSDKERDRVEYLADEIMRVLRQHPRAEQSETVVRSGVRNACVTMMAGGLNQRAQKSDDPRWRATPAEIAKSVKLVRKLSSSLLKVLERVPPQVDWLLFEDDRSSLSTADPAADQWSPKTQFTKQLQRLAAIKKYETPHHNYDSVKELSADVACLLMITCSKWKPASTAKGRTAKGPLRNIAAHLYEIACPSGDKLLDLKRACNSAVKKYRDYIS
jgi:hypothetical protein